MTRVRVWSPVGETHREDVTLPALPESLAGRTVGFVDNTKHNFDRLADAIGVMLRERHG
ncbi:MAG: UGSC family (seleno)protein, partial [Gammaproteobacteria bacterium]